jgi:hypothetical protein
MFGVFLIFGSLLKQPIEQTLMKPAGDPVRLIV